MTQTADTTDATARMKAIVAAHVDQALARRIDDELGELPDIGPHQRVQWIAEILARRDRIIEEVTTKASRLADEPSAPTVDLQ
ncbi:hypothetical protein [Bosea sp. 685]|uniref:hypothetical protein n=1 Tax=Bosea sp. 685 TaxID=3080057 RepID=UPI0028929A67|nr:hypothetical protein [Bosea sp. 685]WNJ93037.1 hypothetical protein RMR04_12405 [Bosea sp. 685]